MLRKRVKKLTEHEPSERSRVEGRLALELLVETPIEQREELVGRGYQYERHV